VSLFTWHAPLSPSSTSSLSSASRSEEGGRWEARPARCLWPPVVIMLPSLDHWGCLSFTWELSAQHGRCLSRSDCCLAGLACDYNFDLWLGKDVPCPKFANSPSLPVRWEEQRKPNSHHRKTVTTLRHCDSDRCLPLRMNSSEFRQFPRAQHISRRRVPWAVYCLGAHSRHFSNRGKSKGAQRRDDNMVTVYTSADEWRRSEAISDSTYHKIVEVYCICPTSGSSRNSVGASYL